MPLAPAHSAPGRGRREHTRTPCDRRPLLPCGVLLALTLAGCFGDSTRRDDPIAASPPADTLWERAEVARIAGRHSEAAELYATFHRYHARDPRAAEALLDAGTEFRRAGRLDDARNHLVTAAQRGDVRITPHAWLQLGYLERSQEQFAGAAMRFRDAAIAATDLETRAEALLEAGLSLQKAGAFREARIPLEECIALDATAPVHAAEARVALEQPPHFTVQVGVFRERSHADELVGRLARERFAAVVEEISVEGLIHHRVTSGEFSRRPEAQAHADRLERAGHSVWIKP